MAFINCSFMYKKSLGNIRMPVALTFEYRCIGTLYHDLLFIYPFVVIHYTDCSLYSVMTKGRPGRQWYISTSCHDNAIYHWELSITQIIIHVAS